MLTSKQFPQPLLSLTLLLTWLLLNNSVAPGHILLGTLLAVLLPYFSANLWPERPQIHHPGTLLLFIGKVLLDILIANIIVARLILGPKKTLQPRFIYLPLELENKFAVTLLASTISLTPGTVSSDLSADRKTLLIHCLNVDDETALISKIKTHYETPLKKVFESC